jgi:hypothetical protein
MKKMRFLLPMIAMVFAMAAGFVTTADADKPGIQAYYELEGDCDNPGVTQQDNCSTLNDGNDCTIFVSPNVFPAHETSTLGECASPLKQVRI